MSDGQILLPPVDPALRDAALLTQQQVIYNKIVQKKDSIKKIYKLPYQIKFSNIEDLHKKIMAAASTYKVKAESHAITVAYMDNGTHQYPSFEKFKFNYTSGASAVSHVNLEYNFYIEPSSIENEASHYKLTVDLSSHVANFYCEKDIFESFFWKKFRDNTAMVKVEYVDYFIAQNFENILSKWFSSLEAAPSTKIFDVFQKNSHYAPRIVQIIVSIFSIYFLYTYFSYPKFEFNLIDLPKIFLISAGSVFILYSISFFIGKGIEYSLDKVCKLSYIELNDGDKALICRHKKESSKNIVRILVWFFAFIFNILLTYLVKAILHIA